MKRKEKLSKDDRLKFLNSLALASLILATIVEGLFIINYWPLNLPLGQALLFARSPKNHSIIFILVLISFWTIVVERQHGVKTKKYLSSENGYAQSLLLCLLIPAIHETLWFIPDVLTYGVNSGMLPPNPGSTWLITGPTILVIYWKFHGFGRKEFLLIFLTGMMYAIWFAVGFPITEGYLGPTQFFWSIPVNLEEIGSWGFVSSVWIIIQKA